MSEFPGSFYGGSYWGGFGGGLQPATSVPPDGQKPQTGQADIGTASIGVTDPREFGTYGFGGPGGYLNAPLGSPMLYLTLLQDPVLAAARAYALSPIVTGTWRIVGDDGVNQSWIDDIRSATWSLLEGYRSEAVWGVDMGWAGWQVVWERAAGKYQLDSIIPCRPEASQVLYDSDTGAYAGLRFNTSATDLYGMRAFIYTYDRRAQHWTGRSRLENVIQAVWNWRDCNDNTAKLAKKQSGIVQGVGYPPGVLLDPKTGKPALDANGQPMTRKKSAEDFGRVITSGSGYYVFPTMGGLPEDAIMQMIQRGGVADLAKLLATSMWQFPQVDLGDHGPAMEALTTAKRYYDEAKCLGYYVPPESILNASHGNRAKGEQMSDNAALMNEPVNRGICASFNRGVVDNLLELRWGKEARGKVRWEPEPLADKQAAFDQTLIQAWMTSTGDGSIYLQRNWDLDAVFERNGINKRAKPLTDEEMGDLLPPKPAPGQPMPPGTKQLPPGVQVKPGQPGKKIVAVVPQMPVATNPNKDKQ